MWEGYCIDGGGWYYCTDTCMIADGLSWAEFLNLHDDGEGDSYYTEWYEELEEYNKALEEGVKIDD